MYSHSQFNFFFVLLGMNKINASVFFQTGLNCEYKFPYREPSKKTRNKIIVYCKSQYWVNASISCTRKKHVWSHGESQTTNRQPNLVNRREKIAPEKSAYATIMLSKPLVSISMNFTVRPRVGFCCRTGWVFVIARKLNQNDCVYAAKGTATKRPWQRSTTLSHIGFLSIRLFVALFWASTFNFPQIAT